MLICEGKFAWDRERDCYPHVYAFDAIEKTTKRCSFVASGTINARQTSHFNVCGKTLSLVANKHNDTYRVVNYNMITSKLTMTDVKEQESK